MIPKTIHYCWFGGKALPEQAVRCINSWKKFFPDYEIKEWNEENFDINICRYVREAYDCKKWAFVSDYARFWILYTYGGIYFDTDVEVIAPMNDIIEKGAFMGCEERDKSGSSDKNEVNPGLGIGAEPRMKLYKELMDLYENESFIDSLGNMNLKNVVVRTTSILLKHGFLSNDNIEYISNVYIYPTDYFCPKNYYTGEVCITKNTRTIHHYDASWLSKYDVKAHNIMKKKKKNIIEYKVRYMYVLFIKIVGMIDKYGVKGAFKYIKNKY